MDVLAAAISDASTIPLPKPGGSTYPFDILPVGEMGTFVPADLIREVADAVAVSVRMRFPGAEEIVSPEPGGHTWGTLAAFPVEGLVRRLGIQLAALAEAS